MLRRFIGLQGFDHIVLRVRDKAAMLGFYEGVLGLAVDRDRPELGLTHVVDGLGHELRDPPAPGDEITADKPPVKHRRGKSSS